MQTCCIAQTVSGGNTMFLAVIVAVTSWLLFRTFLKRQSNPRFRPPTDAPSGAPLVGAPRDIARWQVEMHDLARDLTAQLDSKMAALQHLVQQAGQESERLERALAQAREHERK